MLQYAYVELTVISANPFRWYKRTKMKIIRRIAVALLLFISMIACGMILGAGKTVSALAYSKNSNSGTRHTVCTTLDGTGAGKYYTGSYTYESLSALTPSELFNAIRKLMTDTHKTIAVYGDCLDMAPMTDCENGDGKINLFYLSKSVSLDGYQSGSGWGREHIWHKSKGGDSTALGGADLHHVRPSDSKISSMRGNLKYGNALGGSAVKDGEFIGGYRTDSVFEPLDNVKGDIARICLYMYVRWNDGWGCSDITKVFESVDALLSWCALDPVDTWEMGRNEVVSAFQGNRNVFIDYPELAWLIFDREIPDNLVTPSGIVTEKPEPCSHATTEIRNAFSATCNEKGYTGDTYCVICGVKISDGIEINASGEHVYYHACDNDCNECGFIRETVHSYKAEWISDEEGHWHPCTVCGLLDKMEKHRYDSSDDNNCNICGYVRQIVSSSKGETTVPSTTAKTTTAQSTTPSETTPSDTTTAQSTTPSETTPSDTTTAKETSPDVTTGNVKYRNNGGTEIIVTNLLLSLCAILITVITVSLTKKKK